MTLKHETFIIFLTIILLAGLTGCKKQEVVTISDAERIQGTWNGKELDTGRESGEWTIIITGDQIKVDGPGPEDYAGTITFDETTNPKSARVTILECAAEQYIGAVANAIYKFENDTLYIAASEPGSGTIPAYFEGNGNIRYYEYYKAPVE